MHLKLAIHRFLLFVHIVKDEFQAPWGVERDALDKPLAHDFALGLPCPEYPLRPMSGDEGAGRRLIGQQVIEVGFPLWRILKLEPFQHTAGGGQVPPCLYDLIGAVVGLDLADILPFVTEPVRQPVIGEDDMLFLTTEAGRRRVGHDYRYRSRI